MKAITLDTLHTTTQTFIREVWEANTVALNDTEFSAMEKLKTDINFTQQARSLLKEIADYCRSTELYAQAKASSKTQKFIEEQKTASICFLHLVQKISDAQGNAGCDIATPIEAKAISRLQKAKDKKVIKECQAIIREQEKIRKSRTAAFVTAAIVLTTPVLDDLLNGFD